MPWVWLLFAIALAGGGWWWTHERPVSRPPGVLAAAEPVQQDLDPPPRTEAQG